MPEHRFDAMKVLLATTFYPPEGKAGTEVYTKTLAEGLYLQGHTVHVICVTGWNTGSQHWNGVYEEQLNGVHVHRLALNWQRAPTPNYSLFYNAALTEWFERLLAELQPDIVHVISCLTLSTSIVNVAKLMKRPVLITLMDFWFLCPRHTLLRYDGTLCDGRTTSHECLKCLAAGAKVYRWSSSILPESVALKMLDLVSRHHRVTALPGMRGIVQDITCRKRELKQALQQANCLISHSRFLADTFHAAGVSRPIEVIVNGHDLNWQLDQNIGAEHRQSLRFGTLSHVAEIKGVHLAVEAFLRLDARQAAELWIYGRIDSDTDYNRRLIASIAGHPGIHLQGTYERHELGVVLSQLDVIVVPSLWYENAPLTIYEAFAAGKPVIASNLGGMAEAVTDEVNGLLFNVGDAESLHQQMQRIIQEPGLLDRLKRGILPVRTTSEEIQDIIASYILVLNSSDLPSQ